MSELAGTGLARVVEFGTLTAALVLGAVLVRASLRAGRLTVPALCYLAGLSIFWQEFYADWGAYLAWSPAFADLPWGSTTWTTPDKPWFVVPAYAVFMCLAFTAMLALTRRSLRDGERPSLARCALTAGLPLIVINTTLELVAVWLGHVWTYVDVLGPSIDAGPGVQPLLYPNLPFGAFGTVIVWLVPREPNPSFERLLVPPQPPESSDVLVRTRLDAGLEARRALTWVAVWNACYWLLLCTPLIVIREVFGDANALVP